ncbi:MAG: PKD domain-containing protein, partial [Bacteroidota bacterium]
MNILNRLSPRILLTLGMLLLTISAVRATHLMGVDIAYECLDSCNYRITHTSFYDCSGGFMNSFTPISNNNPVPPPSTFDFAIEPVGVGCNLPTPNNTWTFDTLYGFTDVTPVCPTITTSCTNTVNPDVKGVVAVRYYIDYNFCNANCPAYTIRWRECCRNNVITSLNNPGGVEIYVNTLTIDLQNAPCNNSPVFTTPPVPYICNGQSFTFNQGVLDPDGDSLVFSLGDCFDFTANASVVPYSLGYSATQPLGPNWNVTVNSLTGDITVTPNANPTLEIGVLCVYVDEYRNGVLIGQTVRDAQLTVIDCNAIGGITNNFPQVDSFTNITGSGSVFNGPYTITTCACQEVCFDIPGFDLDPNQSHRIFWSQNLDGAYLTDPTNPLIVADSIEYGPGVPPVARFCWIPTVSGTYTTTFTIQDDGCPILGQNQYSAIINVVSCSLDPVATTRKTGCYEMEFSATPCGGAPPFTYQWSGTGGLNGVGKEFTYDYLAPGVYPYTLTVTDSTGVSSSITDTLFLVNTSVADAGVDKVSCSNDPVVIGTAALPNYTYQWSSPQGAGWNGTPNPAIPQPQAIFSNGSQVPISIPYYVEAID